MISVFYNSFCLSCSSIFLSLFPFAFFPSSFSVRLSPPVLCWPLMKQTQGFPVEGHSLGQRKQR